MSNNIRLEIPEEMAHVIASLLNNSLVESAALKDRETGRLCFAGNNESIERVKNNSEQEIIDQIAASGLSLRQFNQATERAQQEIDRLAAATQATLTRLEEKFGC